MKWRTGKLEVRSDKLSVTGMTAAGILSRRSFGAFPRKRRSSALTGLVFWMRYWKISLVLINTLFNGKLCRCSTLVHVEAIKLRSAMAHKACPAAYAAAYGSTMRLRSTNEYCADFDFPSCCTG